MTTTTFTLPAGAAAQAVARKRMQDMTNAEMAAVDFGPWELAHLCEVPTREDWKMSSRSLLNILQAASQTANLSKAEVVEKFSKLSWREVDQIFDEQHEWAARLRAYLALLEVAQDRQVVALAARDNEQQSGKAA